MKNYPKPTGEYAVGTKTFTIYNTRKEELDPSGKTMRHVPARLYYPTDKTEGLEHGRSMTRSEAIGIKKAFMVPVNYDKMEESGENISQCFVDAPFIEGKKFPLIVFNHGYFSYVEGNSFLLIDLASHGYFVMSVGHPYEGASTDFDDGTYQLLDKSLAKKMYDPYLGGILAAMKLTKCKGTLEDQDKLFDEFQDKYCGFLKTRIEAWITDTDIAVKHVRENFKDQIDLTNGIGIAGHSHGGAVAYKYLLTNDDYTCGINIDGGLFGDYEVKTNHKPFLQISCKDNEKVVAKGYLNHTAPAYKVLFRDMKHIAFSDMKHNLPPSPMLGGKLDADLAHQNVCKVFLEFFDCYLRKIKSKPDLKSDNVITVTEYAPDV